MKKNSMVMALLGLLTASCSTTQTDELLEVKNATLQISVRSLELSSMTRAAVDAKDVLKTVDLALYSIDANGNLTFYKSASLDVLNTSPCTLTFEDIAFGKYQVLAVGSLSSFGGHATLTNISDVSYQENLVPVTFRAYQSLVVNAATENVTLTLEPTVASFRIYMNGAVPEGVTNLLFEVSNAANHFNGTSGLADTLQVGPYTHQIVVPADREGTVNLNARVNMFLTTADLSTGNSDVAIKVSALNSKGETMYSHDFQNVPLKVGSITTYTGNFFQDDELSFTIQVNNSWGTLSGTY